MNCKNCTTEFEGNFCPECGQKPQIESFTMRSLGKQFFHILTNIERGMWPTIWKLLVRPHVVIEEYLDGKSQSYINPFRFLVLVATFVALATVQFDFLAQQAQATNPGLGAQGEFATHLFEMMGRVFHFMVIASVPFYTLFSWWFLRKRGRSAGEHLIMNSFLVAERQLFLALLIPVLFFVPEIYGWTMLLFTVLAWTYYSWALKNQFKISAGKALAIGFAVNVLATGLYMIFMGIVLVIVVIIQVKFFGLEIAPSN